MEMISVPKQKFEEMKSKIEIIEKLDIDLDLLDQIKESLEDVKARRIRRVA